VKSPKEETWCQYYLADQQLQLLQEKVDADLAEKFREGGCLNCGGKVHRANYRRKPRGGAQRWNERDSFCCAQEGCRKRLTPPSVRFLGRKIYTGTLVVLVSAMRHGLKAARIQVLRESLGIDRRTLERWREWWLSSFVESLFWKAARARFMPPICEKALPWSLCQAFGLDRRDRLLDLLKFLSPITTRSVALKHLI
jgi:hypothetical protein